MTWFGKYGFQLDKKQRHIKVFQNEIYLLIS